MRHPFIHIYVLCIIAVGLTSDWVVGYMAAGAALVLGLIVWEQDHRERRQAERDEWDGPLA